MPLTIVNPYGSKLYGYHEMPGPYSPNQKPTEYDTINEKPANGKIFKIMLCIGSIKHSAVSGNHFIHKEWGCSDMDSI